MKTSWSKLLSSKRLGTEDRGRAEEIKGQRSEFERDYDRLVFSPAFRRLQNKTQVFPLPTKIFVHNRLTHSLEVSCVGRSLGNIVSEVLASRHGEGAEAPPFRSAISAIVSAACLAHDMGNPPFGHSGERAIGAYFREGNGRKWEDAVVREGGRWSDFLHFEGNANALRLLTHQFLGRRPGGFALTYSTLASIVKYPYGSDSLHREGKFGFFQTEEGTMRQIADELGLVSLGADSVRYARHPLVYLVEAADDICYQIMDIEDACKVGILGQDEAKGLISGFIARDQIRGVEHTLRLIGDPHEQLGYLRSKAINQLVDETAHIFLDSEGEILSGQFAGSLMDKLSPELHEAYRTSQELAEARIYRAKEVLEVELAGLQIFSSLLDRLLEALHQPDYAYSRAILSRVSSQYDVRVTSTYGRIQCALDYISGMTDMYALGLYQSIMGLNLPTI